MDDDSQNKKLSKQRVAGGRVRSWDKRIQEKRQPLLALGPGRGAGPTTRSPMFNRYAETCDRQLRSAKERVQGLKFSRDAGMKDRQRLVECGFV